MKKRVGIVLACVLVIAGIGIMLIPAYFKKENRGTQNELLKAYQDIVKQNVEKEMPTQQPQQEDYKYHMADFIEENSNDSTKDIIKRQQILGLITCEKLDLKYVVVEGATRDNIRATIGHITGTAGFGGDGNCVLAGHRGGYYGTFFKDIDQLEKGDTIVLTDLYNRTYTYVVYKQQIVESTDLWVCDRIKSEDTLTLLSCENRGIKRRIVRCKLVTKKKEP